MRSHRDKKSIFCSENEAWEQMPGGWCVGQWEVRLWTGGPQHGPASCPWLTLLPWACDIPWAWLGNPLTISQELVICCSGSSAFTGFPVDWRPFAWERSKTLRVSGVSIALCSLFQFWILCSFSFFFCHAMHGMWDLTSLTRDQTLAPCSGSTEP